MGYNPKTEYEKEFFPNLGRVKIVGGPERYIGREGTVIQKAPGVRPDLEQGCIRVAFDNFWNRSDGAIDFDDNGYFFKGEYEEI